MQQTDNQAKTGSGNAPSDCDCGTEGKNHLPGCSGNAPSAIQKNERADVYQIVTNRVLELLDKGIVPWHKPWASDERPPMNLASGKAYRGLNVFMLHVAGYGSPYWLTFKQMQERGGRLREGEKSSIAVFWKSYKRDKATGKEIKGEPTEEQECSSAFVLRYYRVFNVEQMEGIDYPKPEARSVDFNPIVEAQRILEGMPKPPTLQHVEQRAYYRASTDTVNLPQPTSFDGSEQYYATAFHEFAHSTGHESRLKRFDKEETVAAFGSGSYAKEELVAEMAAAFLCGQSGIVERTIDNSAAYIGNWSERLRNDRKLVVMAAAQGQKAADYILGKFGYGSQ